MSMSPHVGDREQDKFRELPSGETAVAVTVEQTLDEDGDKQDIIDGAGKVTDPTTRYLLKQILLELRLINVHLSVGSDVPSEPNRTDIQLD